MPAPKAVKFVAAPEGYSAIPPEEFAVVGDLPGGGEGPQGPQGPQGDTGPQGPAGPAGADGADGFPTEAQWDALVARVDALEG